MFKVTLYQMQSSLCFLGHTFLSKCICLQLVPYYWCPQSRSFLVMIPEIISLNSVSCLLFNSIWPILKEQGFNKKATLTFILYLSQVIQLRSFTLNLLASRSFHQLEVYPGILLTNFFFRSHLLLWRLTAQGVCKHLRHWLLESLFSLISTCSLANIFLAHLFLVTPLSNAANSKWLFSNLYP